MEQQEQNHEQEALEAALERREAAVCARERAIFAREALAEAGLPQALAGHMDFSSDEAMKKGLTLAREARRLAGASALGAPKAAGARMAGEAGYAQRALLYQADRNDYLNQYKGDK